MSWIAWEKLHFSKNEGGLGVRDFQAFNKALLAKQAWRVFTNAQFLMSKVLEGKYFPSINFLEARLNYNASFTWKSICAARNLVLKRARKVVGSGGSINIWKDPWVSGLPNFKVWSRREVDSEDSLQIVYELIESGIWKREIVDALFAEQEASAIKNIPLPAHSCEDVWMWHHTKLGFFLVKSAYYIELKDSRAPVVSSSENRLGIVWRKKRNAGGSFVSSSGEAKESMEHMLLHCDESKRIWYYSSLRIVTNQVRHYKFADWMVMLVNRVKDKAWWNYFWCLCWMIWKRRNVWLFDKRKMELREIIDSAMSWAREYECAVGKRKGKGNVCSSPERWVPLKSGVYKLNVGAAILERFGVGLGGVARDVEGDVMAATYKFIQGSYEVDVAEAMSARHALKVAVEKRKSEPSVFGRIAADILAISDYCTSISFSHVRRKGNIVAHKLANLSRSFDTMRFWLEEVPAKVSSFVLSDILL
ncbi:uncharacterized protein LOC110684899 [Chenopodium quinoa]|uniref:uncharacterized protein LOC110684899 n=1 Tax=Chenopodium quinoa TaxID=63459 RepID=UPI000B77C3B2|nr:uncharacterized protein LOC110684899 [Chenopodium quinoa]